MFNGIIFNKGLITKISRRSKGINIFVKSDLKLTNKDIGVSVACDGVCLTLITIKKGISSCIFSVHQPAKPRLPMFRGGAG